MVVMPQIGFGCDCKAKKKESITQDEVEQSSARARSLLLLASDPVRGEEGSERVLAYPGSDFTRHGFE